MIPPHQYDPNDPDWIPRQPPLLALLMAPDFIDSVFSGEKTITIREGWRDYEVGRKVVICKCKDRVDPNLLDFASNTGWAIMAKITGVTRTFLKEVPIKDLNDDLFESVEDAVEQLSTFYPNITPDSPVTIIRWELI